MSVRQLPKRLSDALAVHVLEAPASRWLVCAGAGLLTLVVAAAVQLATGASLQDLEALGYPGLFVLMFVSGGSIFFPVPGMASVLAAGAVWNPALVGLSAGLGNAVGELTGYVAGRAGAAMLEGRHAPHWWLVVRAWLQRHAFFIIVLLAMVPNPVFDTVGLLAGSIDYPLRRFWVACVLGNTIKYTAAAYFGDYLTGNLRDWLGWFG